MIRHPQSRRGVVILIVLSLLVLFVLLVVTFAIVAGQYRRAALAVGRQEWLGEDPQKTADRVMYALLREPDVNQLGSPFRGHALLTDVYGKSMRGQVSGNATPLAGGQIVQFNFTPSWTPRDSDQLNGFYNGSVLTFVDGPLQKVSARVVAYAYTSGATPVYTLRIMDPENDGTSILLPQNGNTFVLNGKPFVGTGFGYVSNAVGSPRLSAEALKPNRVGDDLATLLSWVAGGANESYDAADYQNLILAAVTPGGVLPSFHRPDLISYWGNTRDASSWGTVTDPTKVPADWPSLSIANRDFRRKLIFRPMPWDHPNFTGSNAAFDSSIHSADEIARLPDPGSGTLGGALFNGPWDVDNDGDGLRDSLWIDPDLPIQTTEDGRTFKPLVAILCTDLDGRLNVNAHGNYVHVTTPPSFVSVPLPGGVSSAVFPKGQGYGPPEVNLNALINDNAQYQVLLQARYGADGSPGYTGYDPLMPFKLYSYPGNYFSNSVYASTFFNRTTSPATPFVDLSEFYSNMDLRGLFAVGVDHRGQPLYEFLADSTTTPPTFPDQLADSPYEMNLNRPSPADAPFTVAELEKALRARDYDVSTLRSRLTDASNLPFVRNNVTARLAMTTDSWEIPVPGVVAPDGYPRSSLTLSSPPQTIAEVLADRLADGGCPPARISTEVSRLLSPDLLMGLRMDINRPIGNGRDDNNNGVVDDAYGVGIFANLNESLGPEYAKNGNVDIMSVDHDNDGVISSDSDAHLARSYLARHLYVLLMLLKDPGYHLTPAGNNQEDAQYLAQWAVNAVDFRDADSTMTPFEYDWQPFNGWDVDGNIATDDGGHADRRVVWGCERPELLITETLAFHDRRTEDTDTDRKVADPEDTQPNDFDQRLAPRGALFVELYNPWAGHDKWPAEFYHTGAAWSSGVLLNKTNAAGQPVWRLAITDSDDPERFHPNPATQAMPDPERTVYFTNPTTLTGGTNLGTQMHFTTVPAANIAPLLPGRYAVVGTAGVAIGSSYVTTIGRRTDASDSDAPTPGTLGLTTTRQIALTPNGNPNTNQVEVRNNLAPPPTQADPPTVDPPMDSFGSTPQVQPAIAIPIDVVLSTGGAKGKGKGKGKGGPGTDDIWLSISEPIGGYDDTYGGSVWDSARADGEGAYEPPIDTPIDNGRLPDVNGTLRNYRRIHLQRLANPLAPYDAVTNPYLTIDVMPVDLTIFNGVESAVTDPSINPAPDNYGCCQRGANDDAMQRRRLWPQEQSTANLAAAPTDTVHRFNPILAATRQTLGYLNSSYGVGFNPTTAPAAPPFAVTSYVGSPDTSSGATSPTFPWLTWNNRPYASPTELLLVPRSNSSRLLRDFSVADTSGSPYDPTTQGRFHHLLNLFAVDPVLDHAPNLYRLFEYVTVRPRFAGTETLLNPSNTSPHFGSSAVGTEMLHPPFNWISTYREPGRINLNTIYEPSVWNGLWGNHLPGAIPFPDFVDSRRGYGTAGSGLFALDATVPTVFANPYRAPGTSFLIPADGSGGGNLGRLEVDNTLLRTSRTTMGLAPPAAGDAPRLLTNYTDLPRNSDRNAFFSYQALQRMSNLVTCRSNVYALWLTIGYFEVDPVNGQLGQEVGLDTGTTTRHRAFYIIDRSIPVAFEPGQNHNVDRCVLLRRFIE